MFPKLKKFIARLKWAWSLSSPNAGPYYCIRVSNVQIDEEGFCTYGYMESANLDSVSAQVVVDHVALDLVERIEQNQFLDMAKRQVGSKG